MSRHRIIPIIALLFALAACTPVAAPSATGTTPAVAESDTAPRTLVVASHDSFNVSEELVTAFEDEHNVDVQFLQLGDAGEALNKLILSKGAPLADVFFGVDNTFLSRALNADIFVPYQSPLLDVIPDEYELDPNHTLLPVDYGFVNLNADRGWFEEQGIPLPQTLDDLTDPQYSGLLAVENPATSSPGLAFLIATISYFGEDGYVDFWRALRENDVLVTNGWSEAYYDHFTIGSGGAGDRPLVVSYTTSPPADVIYASDGRTEPASVNVNPAGGVFRQIEFIGIVQGTEQMDLAQAWVDAMLSQPIQEDIPLQMFVYPVNPNAALPTEFVAFAEAPTDIADVDPDAIEANREAWIEAWTDAVLR